jgi:hypothetical protein
MWDHGRESKLEGGVIYGGGLYRRSGPAYLIIGELAGEDVR